MSPPMYTRSFQSSVVPNFHCRFCSVCKIAFYDLIKTTHGRQTKYQESCGCRQKETDHQTPAKKNADGTRKTSSQGPQAKIMTTDPEGSAGFHAG